MPKFRDVAQFTRKSNYRINLGWDYLTSCLDDYKKSYDLELDPDFQRAHVWDQEKKIKYIEYICKGGVTGKDIYFNCPSFNIIGTDNSMVLVDGKQRLNAVLGFLNNEFPIFENSYFRDFTDRPRLGFHEFIFHVNDLQTRSEVLQWYIDLNDGGVAHTKEEIEKVKNLLKLESK